MILTGARNGEDLKTALVTGSEGGLGVALCAAFGAAGYRVIGADSRRGDSACDAFVEIDLAAACADSETLALAVDRLRRTVGDHSLSVLVNNAAKQIIGRLGDVTHEDWQLTLATNLTAPFFLIQALAPDLERSRGSVVNIGSVHARATKPGFLSYATSKAALIGLTRAAAVDLAPGVRVIAINPAAIDTPMLRAGLGGGESSFAKLAGYHPLGRIAGPEEIARVVVFLASDDAGFMTGTTVDIDGGILSRLNDPE